MHITIIAATFLFTICCFFRFFAGPFYFGNNSDPSYFYLYNFIDLIDGRHLSFVDHPGTTLEILGAVVLKLFFSSSKGAWLDGYVFQTEKALTIIWFVMLLMYIGSFILLGWSTFKKSKDKIFTGLVLLSGLWLVMIPSFIGEGLEPISANVNSDTMMMTAVNLMLLAIVRFYFSINKESFSHAVIFGFVVAFSLATKLTALPFLGVVMVLLNTWRQRVVFSLIFTIVLGILLLPILSSQEHFIRWVKGLVIMTGKHGAGTVGFDSKIFVQGMIGCIKNYWFYVILWVGATIIGIKRSKLLLAVGLGGGMIQLIIVSKQTSCQYMVPMVGLTSIILALMYKIYPQIWKKGLKYFIGGIVIVSAIMIGRSMYLLKVTTEKVGEMLTMIHTEYVKDIVCPIYRSSVPGCALVFWNDGPINQHHAQVLNKAYPQLFYYDISNRNFKTSACMTSSFKEIKKYGQRVLILGSDQDTKNFEPELTVKKIYSNGGPEAFYEVLEQHSKLGESFIKLAVSLSSEKKYKEALQIALYSKEMGFKENGLEELIYLLVQKMKQ